MAEYKGTNETIKARTKHPPHSDAAVINSGAYGTELAANRYRVCKIGVREARRYTDVDHRYYVGWYYSLDGSSLDQSGVFREEWQSSTGPVCEGVQGPFGTERAALWDIIEGLTGLGPAGWQHKS